MSKMSELHAKAEIILMGYAQEIEGENELRIILDYFKSPLNVQYDTDKIIKKAFDFVEIHGLSLSLLICFVVRE